jgi:hypothetical protein
MSTTGHLTVQFGDLVAAVFDEAEHYTSDPKELSGLAAQTVMHMLRAARRTLAPPLPSTGVWYMPRRSGEQASARAL